MCSAINNFSDSWTNINCIYCNASIKRRGAYLIKAWDGRLFKDGPIFKAKILGYLLNNPVSRVSAYSRVGAYSRGALDRSITVVTKTLLSLKYESFRDVSF